MKDLKECTEHIKKTKALRVSLVVNLIYVLLTILCFFIVPFFIPLENTIIANDYRIFYQSAQTLMTNPANLYSLPDYNMPFRYLPLFSLLFIPYTMIPYELGFVLHTILIGIIQTISFYLIYIISTRFYKIQFNTKVKNELLFLVLMAPLQVPMMMMGQVSHIFILLILIVILLIENARSKRYNIKYEYFLIGGIIGLSISFKPFSILIIPLLLKLFISVKGKKIKIKFGVFSELIIGLSVSQIFNFIYFLIYPGLISEFLNINSTAQIKDYPSSSFTRLISVVFNSFSLEPVIMLILTFILYSLVLSIFLITPIKKVNFPVFIGMVILLIMINFTDSWFLNFLICFMLAFPGLFQFEDEINSINSEVLKKRLKFSNYISYRIIYYGIVYFGAGVVIGLIILPTDPILPFLLIILFGNYFWRLFRIR